MSKQIFFKIALILIVLLVPHISSAQIVITEIMYDPEGTDTGREWVEVQNIASTSVDLSTYKILESGTNHKMTLSKGENSILGLNEFAIIADNVEKFLIDFPGFSGKLLDSTFSLVNTGEELKMISASGAETNKVIYDPGTGGQNTGNSLQLIDPDWIPAIPTPGSLNATVAESESDDAATGSTATDTSSSGSTSTTNQNSTHTSSVSLTSYKPKTALSINSGRDRIATINTPLEFKAIHNQVDSDETPSFKWSMGDGNQVRGSKFKYTFEEEGTYNIVLNANTTENTAVSRSKVIVFVPNVEILLKSGGELVDIMLKNLSPKEINLGGFWLEFEKKTFKFPQDTIVASKSAITLRPTLTKFEILKTAPNPLLKLFYPNGVLLTEFKNGNVIENTQ